MSISGHQDVAGRYVPVGRSMLVQVSQCRAQNVQERGQPGDVQPSSRPQDHVESRPFNEVHDDACPVVGQRDHLPHGHQARVAQDAQIGQAPQGGGSSAPAGQVDDPDDHVTPLSVQPTARGAGGCRAPHDLTNGVALLRQGAECRVGNARLRVGGRQRGCARGADTPRPGPTEGQVTAPGPGTVGGTVSRAVGRAGARRRAHTLHGHHGAPE